MNCKPLLLAGVALFLACSDAAPESSVGEPRMELREVLDRGVPLSPGQDFEVDPNRMGEAPVRVETRLQYGRTKAGELNAVSCDVYASTGDLIIDLNPIVYVEPDRRIERAVGGLKGTTPGLYSVFCSLPAYGLVDDTPEGWTIVPSAPVELSVNVAPSNASAGQPIAIDCGGVDVFGNPVTVENAEYVVSPQVEGTQIELSGHVNIIKSGTFQVGCRVAGLGEAFTDVNVIPGQLSAVRASLSPDRIAYRIDELIEIQWSAQDSFGNAILDGIESSISLPPGGQQVGAARFRLGLPGTQIVTLTLNGPQNSVSVDLTLSVDDGAPAITCLSPNFGEQINAGDGDMVPVTIEVTDQLDIQSVFVGDQQVTPDSSGRVTVNVPAVFGANAIKITAEDAIGERTSQLCGFSAAPQYLPLDRPVSTALRLHLDQDSLDEANRLPEYGSVGDVVRAFLNSEGLYEAIDDALLAANPIVPVACRIPEAFGYCGFSAGMTYGSLRVQGPNDASFEWKNGGIVGDFRFSAVSVMGQMTGYALYTDYVKDLGLFTDWIEGQISVDVQRSATGALRVARVSVDSLELGDISRIDPNPNGGIWSRIVGSFESGVIFVTEYFFEDMILEYIAETIETEAAAYLDDLLGTLGTTSLGGELALPNLSGVGSLGVSWQTRVEGLTIVPGGLLLTASAQFTSSEVVRQPAKGVPVPDANQRAFSAGENYSAAVIDFGLVNQVFTSLWSAGYLDINADVVEYLGGVNLLGTSLSAQLTAPPTISGTTEGKVQISIGPLEGRGSIPLIGLDGVEFRAAATVEAGVALEGGQSFSLTDVEVTDLKLALAGVPIGTAGTNDFELGIRALLGEIINSTLSSFLPSIPIPHFVVPSEYGRFGVPANTRLGLLSIGAGIGVRDLEVEGTFGEIIP